MHLKLKLDPKRECGKVPLEVSNLRFHYPFKENLYDNLSFALTSGERFLISYNNSEKKLVFGGKIEKLTIGVLFKKLGA